MQVAGCGPPVVLVHGFGASVGHWRKNIPALAERHQVGPAAPRAGADPPKA